MFCNIGDYWQRGDYVFRQKLQKIMFPEGVSFDKNTSDYRTFSTNPVAELIACIVATYADRQTKSDCDFHRQSLDVEMQHGLSNKYVKDYQAIVRFIDDSITSLNGFG